MLRPYTFFSLTVFSRRGSGFKIVASFPDADFGGAGGRTFTNWALHDHVAGLLRWS